MSSVAMTCSREEDHLTYNAAGGDVMLKSKTAIRYAFNTTLFVIFIIFHLLSSEPKYKQK